jgi:hypothetical protein
MHVAGAAQAQVGPPFLTNDPGTPGNANWEINLASTQTIARGVSSYQVPQIDLNFGLGDRIQPTYEIPYVLQTSSDGPVRSGWSNGYPGVKWRFLDQGDDGWQLSTFPQIETGASQRARQQGIAAPGPRYLVPMEVTKKFGSFNVDFEAGYYLPGHGPKERILGFAAGRAVTQRLTTLDVGGRYKLGRGVLALFMAGCGVNAFSDSQPMFMGYFGVQILLSNYGRLFNSIP